MHHVCWRFEGTIYFRLHYIKCVLKLFWVLGVDILNTSEIILQGHIVTGGTISSMCLIISFKTNLLSFFLYILPDPLSSIIGRCTLYTPGCSHNDRVLKVRFHLLNLSKFTFRHTIRVLREYDQEKPQSHTRDQPMTPRGRVKERHSEHNKTKATSEMIAKLERTQSTSKQNKDLKLNPHKQWGQQQTMNKQQQSRHTVRLDLSKSRRQKNRRDKIIWPVTCDFQQCGILTSVWLPWASAVPL